MTPTPSEPADVDSAGPALSGAPRPLTPAAFAVPDAALLREYPGAYDATTTVGLGPLRRALPDWLAALRVGRSTLPPPTATTRLADLLVWGTGRTWPRAVEGLAAARKRRSSLAHLKGLADDVALAAIDTEALRGLDIQYRERSPARDGKLVSADMTELRQLVAEAREAARLSPLDVPLRWPAAKPHGVLRDRAVASLHGVLATMNAALTCQRPRRRGGPRLRTRWLAGYLALQLAVPLLPTRMLALRRSDILPGRVVVHDAARRARHFGLPPWAVDMLTASLPGWREVPPEALLFPGRTGRARTDVHRVLGIVAEEGALDELTPLAVRRLGQAIHRQMGAARAVVRAGAPSGVSRDGEAALMLADELHAAEVVRRWTSMLAPPGGDPGRLPRRARADCARTEPEYDPLRSVEPAGAVPTSCSMVAVPTSAVVAGGEVRHETPSRSYVQPEPRGVSK